MTSSYGSKSRSGLTGTVASQLFEYQCLHSSNCTECTNRILEYTLRTPIQLACLFNFFLSGLWVHNLVLPRNLISVSCSVLHLLLLIILQGFVEIALQLLCLSRLDTLRSILCLHCIQFQKFDLVLDLRVLELRLRNEVLEISRDAVVGRGEGTLVESSDIMDIGGKWADLSLSKVDSFEEGLLGEGAWVWCNGCAGLRVGGGCGNIMACLLSIRALLTCLASVCLCEIIVSYLVLSWSSFSSAVCLLGAEASLPDLQFQPQRSVRWRTGFPNIESILCTTFWATWWTRLMVRKGGIERKVVSKWRWVEVGVESKLTDCSFCD